MAASKKKSGKGKGVVVLVVVLVVLGGGGVGAYYWNARNAETTVEEFIAAQMDVERQLSGDFSAIEALVSKEDAALVEQMKAASQNVPEQVKQLARTMSSQAAVTTRVTDVSAGLTEATVKVEISASGGSMSHTEEQSVVLLREGLAWKVALKRTGEAAGMRLPTGAPTVP